MVEFPTLEKKLDSMGILSMIEKLVYTSNRNELNTRHNKGKMALMNLLNLHQEISRYTRLQRSVHSHEEDV